MSIGLSAELDRVAAEDLGPRFELDMDLEPDHRFEAHLTHPNLPLTPRVQQHPATASPHPTCQRSVDHLSGGRRPSRSAPIPLAGTLDSPSLLRYLRDRSGRHPRSPPRS